MQIKRILKNFGDGFYNIPPVFTPLYVEMGSMKRFFFIKHTIIPPS
jgi:hypothetical protein